MAMQKIEQAIEERIRPQLALHGGDIEVLGFEDGVLRFKLLGQCTLCPSAYITAEELVQAELTEAVPQVKRAVLVQAVSDELLEQARALLRHG